MTTPIPLSELPQEHEAELVSTRIEMMTNAIQANQEKGIMSKFESCKTNREKFAYVWSIPSVHDVIRVEPEFHAKSIEKAADFRTEGNRYFQRKSYLSALDSYNKAIVHAPVWHEGDEAENQLALSYANRSAALLYLQRYEDGLNDTKLALESSYPKDAAYKLYDRKGKCYLGLRDKPHAIESFRKALELLKSGEHNEVLVATWTTAIEKQLAACEDLPDTGKPEESVEESVNFFEMSKESNDEYPIFSKACKLEYNKKRGRHVVATENIKIGDVLEVEAPYASVLFRRQQSSRCYNCLLKVSCPVPCVNCTSIIFCSEACRATAWDTFHQYECKFHVLFDTLLLARVGHLAVRMSMMAGLKNILEFYQKNEPEPGKEKLASQEFKNGSYLGSYYNAYNLEAHEADRFPLQEFNFCVLSALLMKILTVCDFFKQGDEDLSSTENIVTVGESILHHIHVIQCNGLRLEKLEDGCRFDEYKHCLMAVGMYPGVAMINHCCDPNTDVNYIGKTCYVRATRNIHEGEEVTRSYGPSYFDVELKARRQHLRYTYFFSCECEACEDGWPTVSSLADCSIIFRCEGCGTTIDMTKNPYKRIATCAKCGQEQDIQEVIGRLGQSHEDFASGMSDAYSSRYPDAIEKLSKHLTLMQRYLCQPWRDFTSCEACIKQCYKRMES